MPSANRGETRAGKPLHPVRMILVSDTYPPVMGGAEMDAQRVCAELIRRGHTVTVLCQGGPPMPPRRRWVDDAGVPVRILTRRSTGRWRHILFALRVSATLWRERRNYDVVFFSMFGLHLFTGLPVSRWLGKSILSKVHGSSIITKVSRSWTGRQEIKWLARWAERVMVLNDEMVEEARAAGIPASKILHMPNPVDTAAFAPAPLEERSRIRERLGIPFSARVLLYTGRLSHEKGLGWLIDAFAAVAPEFPDAQLILLGDGPIRARLEEQAAGAGLGARQIRFAGRVPSQEVALWLQAADAFALVSPNEGFSCALAEAMSTGLPAVVSAIPANVQLVEEGAHGYTAPPGDIPATAQAIGSLLGGNDGARMGQAARQRVVENYSLSQVADRYEALFAVLFGNRSDA